MTDDNDSQLLNLAMPFQTPFNKNTVSSIRLVKAMNVSM